MANPEVIDEKVRSIEARLTKYEGEQKEIKEIVTDIRDQLSRYKGFVGGVLFVCSAIAAALTLFFRSGIGK